ncbi:MAG TPA: TIGR03936 family radical SAM-associated protein [Candidatus Cryosericum sp.]|nr:TIGR03936 family radical SAM-associated protein [Candidatus Cryosericum sp.]
MIKMRMQYSKDEEACLLSHHEVQTALVRWLRRSGLPVAYSEGFNQRVRIETGIPTGVGMESRAEYVDVILERWTPPPERAQAIRTTAPPGLTFQAAVDIPLATPSLMAQPLILRYDFAWSSQDAPSPDVLERSIAAFLACPELMVERESGKARAPKDIRRYVLTAQIATRTPLKATVGVFFDQSGTIRMDEVTGKVFGLAAGASRPVVTRQSVLINMNGAFVDPMDAAALGRSPRRPKQGRGN